MLGGCILRIGQHLQIGLSTFSYIFWVLTLSAMFQPNTFKWQVIVMSWQILCARYPNFLFDWDIGYCWLNWLYWFYWRFYFRFKCNLKLRCLCNFICMLYFFILLNFDLWRNCRNVVRKVVVLEVNMWVIMGFRGSFLIGDYNKKAKITRPICR